MIKFLRALFLFGLALTPVVMVLAWFGYLHYSEDLPALHGLADYRPSLISRVYARDYRLLGEFYIERRQFITREEVPSKLVEAILAIEDTDFYKHPGLNPIGIFRAAIANIKARRVVQGASTITQQVAKTFLLSNERSWGRKIREAILSLRIEQQFSKDEILELYLNQIYLGAGAYGVAAAARTYFDRDVTDLTLAQMALIAGLPKAPSDLDPWRYPQAAKKRQGLVLNRMAEVALITPQEAKDAAVAPLELARPSRALEQVAPYYLEHVRREVMEEWGADHLYRSGLEIYTTLDPYLQTIGQDAVRKGLLEYDRRHGYSGPLQNLPLEPSKIEQWRQENMEKPLTPGGFVKALIQESSKEKAIFLLANGTRGELTLEGVKWARKRLRNRDMGPSIRAVSDVLSAGDEVLVAVDAEGLKHELGQEPDAEAALVCLDPHTGQVLALVGGYDFERSEFNRATQAVRQPGSSFKPILYSLALEQGYTPSTRIDDTPIPIAYYDSDTGEKKIWRAENYEQKFYGPTTLRVALEHSRNLVTIRLVKTLGVREEAAHAARFGLVIPDFRKDLSLALGTVGFTPLKMAASYSVFANGGKMVEPVFITRVQDRQGRTIARHGGGDCLLCHHEPEESFLALAARHQADEGKPKEEDGDDEEPMGEGEPSKSPYYGARVLSPETAYQMTSILRGVIQNGTGSKARHIPHPLGGKTGTTNDMRDAWFIGFGPALVTAAWVGLDDNGSLGRSETGAKAALPIWMSFMERAVATDPDVDFIIPEGIRLISVDGESGRKAGPGTKRVVLEAFKGDEGPSTEVGGDTGGSALPQQWHGVDGGLY